MRGGDGGGGVRAEVGEKGRGGHLCGGWREGGGGTN